MAKIFRLTRSAVLLVLSQTAACGQGAPWTLQSAIAPLTAADAEKGQIAVLVPDGLDAKDPRLSAWMDAGQEQGLLLTLLSDSTFLSAGTRASGIILPDQIHPRASAALIDALKAYAAAGGALLIDYDFGTLDENGFYPIRDPSRLAELAGIPYAFYEALRGAAIGLGPVRGLGTNLRALQVPPGKSMPLLAAQARAPGLSLASAADARRPVPPPFEPRYLSPTERDPGGLATYRHALQFQAARHGAAGAGARSGVEPPPARSGPMAARAPAAPQLDGAPEVISGYVYGPLQYPTFVTSESSTYDGRVLLTSVYGLTSAGVQGSGVAAGSRSFGLGSVLFVNLPLGYLKGATDTMLMNGFLQYFAASLSLPRLSENPNGTGGLVFNWHVDAAEALTPIAQLDAHRVWDHGPFSVHFTAGPDTIHVGDNLGMNASWNPAAQFWIRTLAGKRHRIGSHGGWVHDLYAEHATEYPPGTRYADMSYRDVNPATGRAEVVNWPSLLVWNKLVLELIALEPVIEYSAPGGNNPRWALDWAQESDFTGYYYAGHTGAGPTRAYRPADDASGLPGAMLDPKMWAFPVSVFGPYATFEEFEESGISPTAVDRWYSELLEFVAENHTSRLIYAHPPGAMLSSAWTDALLSLLAQADAMQSAGRFRWYTISELASFASRRLAVSWSERDAGGSRRIFRASHPTSLSGLSWLLPSQAYSPPSVVEGTATVKSDGKSWIVTAVSGRRLEFTSAKLPMDLSVPRTGPRSL